jgi:hypothetical protein
MIEATKVLQLLQCLSRALPPSLLSSSFYTFSSGKYKPADDHWILLFHICELFPVWRQALTQFIQNPTENLNELCRCVASGLEMDRKMDAWSRDLPPEWGYTLKVFNKQSSPQWLFPLLETSWAPRWIHEYSSILIEYKWRGWWMVKIMALQATLQSIAHMESRGYGPQSWPSGLEKLRRTEVEHNLLNAVDGAFESCCSILVRPLRGKPESKGIEDVSTVRGYLVFPSLMCAHVCLLQSSFTGINVEGRRQWGQRAMDFLQHDLGCAKAGSMKGLYQFEPLQIQLWSIVEQEDMDID